MASSPYEASVEDEINAVSMGRPHVVLLGAGASRAAFLNGDRNGKILPLMADFVKHVPITLTLGTEVSNAAPQLGRESGNASLRSATARC